MAVQLSIIIPCYNEASTIAKCIEGIKNSASNHTDLEIIVVDGNSIDGTIHILKTLPVTTIFSTTRGRAKQLNIGAQVASGEILYFLHADTLPPPHFDLLILEANNSKIDAGCFRLKFDHKHWFLKANAWFTRFNFDSFRFGDQSLFINKMAFVDIGGFNEASLVFEDQEIIKRIRQYYIFKVLRQCVISSARMYLKNGIYFTQLYYFYLFVLYQCGASQALILSKYRRNLNRCDIED